MLLTLLTATTLAQAPGFVGAFEEALDAYSFGPTIAAHALIDRNGVAPAFAAGFGIITWDVEKTYEPRCLEHRQREREQLGVENTPLGDVVEDAQQQCPAISEQVNGSFAFGAELEVAVRTQRELALRTYATFLQLWRSLAFGTMGTLAFADRAGSTAVGLRLGVDVSYRFRFGQRGFRPALEPFVFGEAVVINRDNFTDQIGLGVRFLYDL